MSDAITDFDNSSVNSSNGVDTHAALFADSWNSMKPGYANDHNSQRLSQADDRTLRIEIAKYIDTENPNSVDHRGLFDADGPDLKPVSDTQDAYYQDPKQYVRDDMYKMETSLITGDFKQFTDALKSTASDPRVLVNAVRNLNQHINGMSIRAGLRENGQQLQMSFTKERNILLHVPNDASLFGLQINPQTGKGTVVEVGGSSGKQVLYPVEGGSVEVAFALLGERFEDAFESSNSRRAEYDLRRNQYELQREFRRGRQAEEVSHAAPRHSSTIDTPSLDGLGPRITVGRYKELLRQAHEHNTTYPLPESHPKKGQIPTYTQVMKMVEEKQGDTKRTGFQTGGGF